MTELKEPVKVTFRQEGEKAFPIAEKEPSEASPAEPTAPVVEKPAEPEKKLPFNEDPDVQNYIERQVATRTEGIEKRLEEKFKGNADAIRKEIGEARDKNAAQDKIPAWFAGGADTPENRAAWDEYRKWFDGQLDAIEERAITKTFERASSQSSEQQKRIDEATEFFQGELKAITADKMLNPTGKAIDPNALLKTAMDNDLVDSKGRWNYRAAMRLMTSHPTAAHAGNKENKEKKELAAATMEGSGGGGGEPKPKNFKTPEDFKKKRPW